MGKSCMRFKSVEDLALDVIGEAIKPGAGEEVHRALRGGLKAAKEREIAAGRRRSRRSRRQQSAKSFPRLEVVGC